MTKFIVRFFAILAVHFLTSVALAQTSTTYIYEPFDYTPGQALGPASSSVSFGLRNTQAGTTAGTADNSVNTANANYTDGGTGNKWLRAAPAANFSTGINIASGGLSLPTEANTLKNPVGNDLTITGLATGGNYGTADRLAFNAGVSAGQLTSGTVYYSFLMNVSSLTNMLAGTTGGDYFVSLNNTANNNTTAFPTVHPAEMRIRVDPNGTQYDLGMFTQHASVADTNAGWSNVGAGGISMDVNRTYFVVGAYTFNTTNSTSSTKLWINPDQSTFGGASAATVLRQDTVSGTSNTIGSILLHQRSVGTMALDELRVGNTWSSVTPLGTATLYWVGAGGASPTGTWDSNISNTAWNNASDGSGNAVAWTADSVAVFSAGATATGTYGVTVSGTQSASTIIFEDGTPTLSGGTVSLTGLHTITTNSGVTATIGSIGGTVGMVKDGSGTLVLNGNQSYSGATVISGGTLQIGDGGTTGSLPTGTSITDSGRLTFNRSNAVTQGTDFSGSPLSGSGGLTQAGSGTLTLNAANTFSGTTRAAAGTLLLTNSLALQNSTLDMNGADTGAVSFGSLAAVTLGGLTGSRNLALTSSSVDYNGNGTVDAADYALWRKSPNSYGGDPGGYNAWRAQFGNSGSGTLAVSIGSSTSPAAPYTGVLSGSGISVIKIGTNTQVLSGANTYNGGTTINAGVLQFGKTFAMPSTGNVVVNSSGTLAVNSNGTDEWTESTDTSVGGTIGSLMAGRGGQGAANQITWMPGSAMGIDTTNASGGAMTYSGVIGSFRTTSGTTSNVGFTKLGVGTLELSGNNTFSGPLSTAANGGTLLLSGSNANAGSTMAIPTVSIGATSTVQIGASSAIPNGSLISTTGGNAVFEVLNNMSQTVRSISGNNGIVTVDAGATLTIADQAGDDYVFGNGAGTANLHTVDTGKIYKTGAGTLTLFGDTGNNFNGEFIMQNGRLNLSRNQALGTTGGTGRLTVTGGQLGRSNTPASNFTYSISNLDMSVFRFDLSDAPAQTSQINAATLTTLKANDVEINITNSGTQNASSGRFTFLGDIRNHDPSPSGGDDPNAIRGITKTGTGVLSLSAATTYHGSTTVQDGVLLMSSASTTLGDTSQPTSILKLKGGVLATTVANGTITVANPVVVDSTTGTATIAQFSTAVSANTVMEFSNDSIVGTSGSLTIANMNTNNTTATVFQPRFTGQGFNFGRPIVVSDPVTVGTFSKSNELEFGNTTGTQTFSGAISGGGSLRRINAGGTTVLSGLNSYTGTTSVDAGTLSITNPDLADGADVRLITGGIFDLNFAGTDTISRLFFDGVSQAVGTYGATGSGATFINNTFFTGSGVLNVTLSPGSGAGLDGAAAVPEPGSLSLMIFAIGSALITCSNRLARRRR